MDNKLWLRSLLSSLPCFLLLGCLLLVLALPWECDSGCIFTQTSSPWQVSSKRPASLMLLLSSYWSLSVACPRNLYSVVWFVQCTVKKIITTLTVGVPRHWMTLKNWPYTSSSHQQAHILNFVTVLLLISTCTVIYKVRDTPACTYMLRSSVR